jgi:glycosyltransferase involved in cell wall biosynthesis
MKNQNIIIISQQNWESVIGTNPRNMAKEFAKNNRVLYVNMPLDVNTLLQRHKEPEVQKRLQVVLGQEKGLIAAEHNVWVYTTGMVLLSANWLTSRPLFKAINYINAKWLATSIRKAAEAIGFESYYILEDGLLYPGLELKRLLRPRKFIYYIRDYVMIVQYFKRHGPWLEPALMKEADIVVANSAYLRDYAQQHNPHSYDIGQGCVLSMYQAEAEYDLPADLSSVPGPTIVYTGLLTALRLDLDLLLAIAQQRPNWHLVFIGPEDEAFQQSLLHQLPNVHFLGTKTPQELGAYLRHCQVCINPQIVNDITVGNYPLKIDEYLAMGKPIVATATRAMEMFADHVYLATGHEQWIKQLGVAIDDNNFERARQRIAFAKSHTWEATVGVLYNIVAELEH